MRRLRRLRDRLWLRWIGARREPLAIDQPLTVSESLSPEDVDRIRSAWYRHYTGPEVVITRSMLTPDGLRRIRRCIRHGLI